jgi:uncharacterized SAM-binding protein YcdF (DUF218 family)
MTSLEHTAGMTDRSDSDAPRSGLPAGTSVFVTITGALLGLFVFGFVLFAADVMRTRAAFTGKADGIIVLTGGDFRIGEGARLLLEGRASRLLISGVNEVTSRSDLIKLSGLDTAMFDCCVDLGYAAQDTVGNAVEARTWATSRNLTRLVVVTSSYHMPRSLAQLAIALPGTELIPHVVVPRKFRDRAWWLQPVAARILLSEYVKYLPVAVRLGSMRYLGQDAAPATASNRPPARSQS